MEVGVNYSKTVLKTLAKSTEQRNRNRIADLIIYNFSCAVYSPDVSRLIRRMSSHFLTFGAVAVR